ncbi:hypothetical protein IGS68_34710 (plasmid) [Skermanella sp. TT6]|uniref:Uncharacterized protein n=1 Tax=Skermanella cutis TaxID=2775420 RepID=A0ABX7BHY0_9PROT|nr:hypothetical protein [Skermanella sp. TT6]QQP93998.1 hypothetical protein IGS68_34710 [Skermanella sp. TT6]
MTTVLPEFNRLLIEAHGSLEELDYFDLDSKDPASKAQFEEIDQRYRKDAEALVEFVTSNRDALIAAIWELGVPD